MFQSIRHIRWTAVISWCRGGSYGMGEVVHTDTGSDLEILRNQVRCLPNDEGSWLTGIQCRFDLLSILPDPSQVKIQDKEHFKIDYTFYLNIAFLAISAYLVYLGFFKKKDVEHSMSEMAPKSPLLESVLKYVAIACYIWLAGGLITKFLILWQWNTPITYTEWPAMVAETTSNRRFPKSKV